MYSAWKKWFSGTPSEHPSYSPDLISCDFWAFPTIIRELQGKKFRGEQWSAAHFQEVGEVLLAKGGTLKKRPSLHFDKVLTRSNKVSPQTLQTALI
jgi:hypothetical protein